MVWLLNHCGLILMASCSTFLVSIPLSFHSENVLSKRDSCASSLFYGTKIGIKNVKSHTLLQSRPRHDLKTFAIFDFIQKNVSGINQRLSIPSREKIKFGDTEVSAMGFGTWAWGNKFLWDYDTKMDPELQNVFDLALDNDINFFDTADSYGTGKLNGQSEKLLGRFIREYPGLDSRRKKVFIATKLATYPWRLTTNQMTNACKESLNRLGLSKLPLCQLHWSPSNYFPFQEKVLWDGLIAMKENDLVENVGVSNYGPKQIEKIFNYLEKNGIKLASAQVQYSLLSTTKEQIELKEFCDLNDIKLIAYSPLALGLLTGKYNLLNLPNGPRGVLFKEILPGLDPLLNVLNEISLKRKKTFSQIAINWCICKGTIPIPGVKSLKQAKDNLGALGWKLSNEEIIRLDDAASSVPKSMVQNIFQTK